MAARGSDATVAYGSLNARAKIVTLYWQGSAVGGLDGKSRPAPRAMMSPADHRHSGTAGPAKTGGGRFGKALGFS